MVGKKFDLGRGMDPGQSLAVHPLAGGEVENATDNLQTIVDGPDRSSLSPLRFDPGLQRAHVQAIKPNSANEWHLSIEMADVIPDAPLVLVLKHEFRRGLLEASSRPDAVDESLPGFFHHSREASFRFLKLISASAPQGCASRDTRNGLRRPKSTTAKRALSGSCSVEDEALTVS